MLQDLQRNIPLKNPGGEGKKKMRIETDKIKKWVICKTRIRFRRERI